MDTHMWRCHFCGNNRVKEERGSIATQEQNLCATSKKSFNEKGTSSFLHHLADWYQDVMAGALAAILGHEEAAWEADDFMELPPLPKNTHLWAVAR